MLHIITIDSLCLYIFFRTLVANTLMNADRMYVRGTPEIATYCLRSKRVPKMTRPRLHHLIVSHDLVSVLL